MTEKEYVRYFNLEIKFHKMIKEYLKKYVLQENEILDVRPMTHVFTSDDELQINYYVTDLSEDFGKRIHTINRIEFEKTMGFYNIVMR